MSPTLERAIARWAQGGVSPPLLCGGCQNWYCPPLSSRGSPDAAGLVFLIGGQEIAGLDFNICGACTERALLGKAPFRRRGEKVKIVR